MKIIEHRESVQPGMACCRSIGVAPTTEIWVIEKNAKFYARTGIAILGSCNGDQITPNPHNDDWHDNYCEGIGDTQGEAIQEMYREMSEISRGLF